MVAIDNPTGEIKALVGGYSFRRFEIQPRDAIGAASGQFIQDLRLRGTRSAKGATPFDTILDAPFTTISGRAALFTAQLRRKSSKGILRCAARWLVRENVPAVKTGGKSWHQQRGRDYAKIWHYHAAAALPAAGVGFSGHETDRNMFSAFTVFPDDGNSNRSNT